MISRDEILSKTGDGLEVFRHYISSDIRIGKYFCSPFYNDTKPSCNIYWNRKAMCFYFKDFGNADDVGDCFYYVGKVKGLDCHNPQHFIEILEIINYEMNLTLNNVKPVTHEAQSKPKGQSNEIVKPYSFTEKEFSDSELEFWGQYGINKMLLQEYNVLSLSEFKSISSANKQFKIQSSEKEPMFGYHFNDYIKIYRPRSEFRFCYGGIKAEEYTFGLEQLPTKGDILFITGGEKDVISLASRGFSAISFNSETADIPISIIANLSHRFKHIVILYDSDETGIKQADKECKRLSEYGVKCLKLPLNGTKEEKDISDYFRLGNNRNNLLSLFVSLLDTLYRDTFAMLSPCEIDLDNPPIVPETIISVNGVPIATQGNLLCITGSEGTGKSNYVNALVAGMLAQSDKIDTLGVDVQRNDSKQAVIMFDTEQSENQVNKNLGNLLRRSGRIKAPDWLKAYTLLCLSRKQRIQAITDSMDKFYYEFSGIKLVVIDGIADLIGSANDETASIEIVDELYRLASIYNTCIVCVLHYVPNGVKLRGHLGSELQRKAAAILSIEKDDEPLSVVKALKVRDGSPLDIPLMLFGWCNKQKMHVYRGEKSREDKENRKEVELLNIAKQIFSSINSCTYKELCLQLQEAMDISERTAKNYIRFMREKLIITNHSDDNTRFVISK